MAKRKKSRIRGSFDVGKHLETSGINRSKLQSGDIWYLYRCTRPAHCSPNRLGR